MAAFAALLSLSKVIHLTLSQEQEYVVLPCSREEMMSLHEEIGRLQDLLEDISGRSHPSLDALESRIRDVAYRLEDLIEEDVPSSFFVKFTSLLCMRSAEAIAPTTFGICAREIVSLLEEAMAMKENNLRGGELSEASHTLTEASSSSERAKVGPNEDLIELLDLITGRGSKLEIVPITGMGGIGKTTLARALYEHPNTLDRFDICLSVTVSQEYNVEEILCGLLPSDQQSTANERMIEFVHKRLKSRRYLVVLDDMWDGKAWDCIRCAFPDDNKGSRIILTTRLLDVAAYVGSSSHVHQMQFLNDEQSWNLLREKVGGNEQWPKKLEDLGRRISRNCRGLPLAIVAIGGLLKFNMTGEYWEQVATKTNSEVAANYDNHLFDILGLSYTNLPAYLKPCFLYFGSYKEDQEIATKELVRLWAAEGFLKPRGSKEMEYVAEEYLEELVARSLVLVKEKNPGGRIKTCSIHDVLWDLSLRKAHEEKFSHHITRSSSWTDMYFKNDLRRATIDPGCFTWQILHHKHVRSIRSNTNSKMLSVIRHTMLIRVLGTLRVTKNSQLRILYALANLRYLHIDLDSIYWEHPRQLTICESICRLQNLETLIFSSYRSGDKHAYRLLLPSTMWEMPRLRHLMLVKQSRLPCPALNKFSCFGLQALSKVTNFDLTWSMAAKLSNLKKLKLHYSHHIRGEEHEEFRLNNLVHLHQLEELNIRSEIGMKLSDFSFPQKLKKLCLQGTKMPVENMSLIGSLPNLEVLKLTYFALADKEWEPIEGQFLQLKYLLMELLDLEEWRAESEHFPQLETLIISLCHWLKEFPAEIGEINTLRKLVLFNCNNAAADSVEEIKALQQSYCNDLLQVSISRND